MSLSFRKSSPLNWNGSNLQGAFGNELIYNIRDTGRNIRNGPSFLDNSIDDLGEYESFCKNWVDQRNVDYDDYFHNKDFWKQDLNFEGWNLPKKSSSTRRTENYDMRESPVPYPKHQITEDIPDIIISDTRWYSPIGIDNDVKDAVNRFVREDTRESLSLLRFHIHHFCSSQIFPFILN
ncbi:hypothetical protein Pfo_006896 [Paulownia fortunei]|nr:hypothetical protein Pfo_006896 [Paulownia fortunei]